MLSLWVANGGTRGTGLGTRQSPHRQPTHVRCHVCRALQERCMDALEGERAWRFECVGQQNITTLAGLCHHIAPRHTGMRCTVQHTQIKNENTYPKAWLMTTLYLVILYLL